MKAKLIIVYEDENEAKAIANALSPDNISVPSGLYVKSYAREKNLITEVDCKKGLRSFITTLDDILACIQASEKVLKSIKKVG